MKKAIMAATAAVAAFGMAPAANAVVTVSDPINLPGVPSSDFFEATVSGETNSWTQVFTFTLPAPFSAGASLSAVQLQGLNNVLFTEVKLNGTALTLLAGGVAASALAPISVASGTTHNLTVTGTGNGLFNGTISVTSPIPEPATWAMMIAGIAAVGMTMRRRNQNVRVAFS